jgi:LPXTG-motif cell wall-anchored protein
LAVAVGLLMGVLTAAPAHAYPVYTEPLETVSGSLTEGGTVTMGGSGFDPGSSVSIDVYSAPIHLATVTADGAGAFVASVQLPDDLAAGSHSLRATGTAPDGGTLVLSKEFSVAGGTLPETGRPIGMLISAAAAVLMVGVGMVVVGLRRRSRLPNAVGTGDAC